MPTTNNVVDQGAFTPPEENAIEGENALAAAWVELEDVLSAEWVIGGPAMTTDAIRALVAGE